jgi:hypothetical protein
MSKTRRYLAEYRVRKRNDEGNTRESRGFYPETRQGVYEVKGTMAKAGGGIPGTVIGDAPRRRPPPSPTIGENKKPSTGGKRKADTVQPTAAKVRLPGTRCLLILDLGVRARGWLRRTADRSMLPWVRCVWDGTDAHVRSREGYPGPSCSRAILSERDPGISTQSWGQRTHHTAAGNSPQWAGPPFRWSALQLR